MKNMILGLFVVMAVALSTPVDAKKKKKGCGCGKKIEYRAVSN